MHSSSATSSARVFIVYCIQFGSVYTVSGSIVNGQSELGMAAHNAGMCQAGPCRVERTW